MHDPNPRRRAYTLIELLIVVGVLGLAGALLVPRMVDQDSMAVQAVVRMVIADLTFAQSDALAHQEFRQVHFYDDGSGYCIVRVTPTSYDDAFDAGTADYIDDPLAGAGELSAYIVDLTGDDRFDGITVSEVDIDSDRIAVTFDDLGGTIMPGNLPGTGGIIEVSSANFTYRITIAPFTGRLTVANVTP